MSATLSYAVTADEFLRSERQKDLLRLVTAGSVDDGKSTLLGRLLYDSQSVYEDQLHAVKRASRGDLELALLTDGLRAEREQGITIDVAYRYFSTAKRKFILADTPGHEQYTRNMATGASNADLAILLVDASRGIQPQSKRHAYIIGLLGIRRLVVVINKMDLTGYSEEVFLSLQQELLDAIQHLDFESVSFFPVSANAGTNVVHRSSLTPWFDGPSLLEFLENIEIVKSEHGKPFRLAVQLVQRTPEFRGYSGQIASGQISVGDRITVLPSLRSTRVKSIVSFDGELERVFAPQSITLTIEDELDISRGDLLVASDDSPFSSSRFSAQMIWFSEQALVPQRRYLLKHTTQTTNAEFTLESKLDIQSLTSVPAAALHTNDIGTVRVETARPIFFDSYRQNRSTGSFIVIDPGSNNTVAAGMIAAPISIGATATSVIRRGRIFTLRGQEYLVRLVTNRANPEANFVLMSVWNRRAADLLTDAGFNVFVVEAPREVKLETADEARLSRLLDIR